MLNKIAPPVQAESIPGEDWELGPYQRSHSGIPGKGIERTLTQGQASLFCKAALRIPLVATKASGGKLFLVGEAVARYREDLRSSIIERPIRGKLRFFNCPTKIVSAPYIIRKAQHFLRWPTPNTLMRRYFRKYPHTSWWDEAIDITREKAKRFNIKYLLLVLETIRLQHERWRLSQLLREEVSKKCRAISFQLQEGRERLAVLIAKALLMEEAKPKDMDSMESWLGPPRRRRV